MRDPYVKAVEGLGALAEDVHDVMVVRQVRIHTPCMVCHRA